ncbi:MAG: GIY-YIG nuclease family protein, partial [bacterium]|nr:GIY-YIG nuclease family protein [bacterium]
MYKDLPQSPGVYIFRNSSKKVVYVGKAINLKSRVSSYFANEDLLDPKTRALVSKIHKIEHIVVKNEIEALLLESELIKRYKPPYNINLKDDKFYKYIYVDLNGAYKIGTTRKNIPGKFEYFGPYPESTSIKIILKTLRKIFPYRDCSQMK